MNLKKLVLGILFFVGCFTVFGQQLTKEQILKAEYGKIRNEMVAEVCNIMEFKDSTICSYIEKDYSEFCKALSVFCDTTSITDKKEKAKIINLKQVFDEANDSVDFKTAFSGNDYSSYETVINKYLSGIKTSFEKDDYKKLDPFKPLIGQGEKAEKQKAVGKLNLKYSKKI